MATLYRVLENNVPCTEHFFPKLKGKGWTNAEFTDSTEATIYMQKWIGHYAPLWDERVPLESLPFYNKEWDYNGYGDLVKLEVIEDRTKTLPGKKS
jgi:hypothetical protein